MTQNVASRKFYEKIFLKPYVFLIANRIYLTTYFVFPVTIVCNRSLRICINNPKHVVINKMQRNPSNVKQFIYGKSKHQQKHVQIFYGFFFQYFKI
jgi:hypothetical protein